MQFLHFKHDFEGKNDFRTSSVRPVSILKLKKEGTNIFLTHSLKEINDQIFPTIYAENLRNCPMHATSHTIIIIINSNFHIQFSGEIVKKYISAWHTAQIVWPVKSCTSRRWNHLENEKKNNTFLNRIPIRLIAVLMRLQGVYQIA